MKASLIAALAGACASSIVTAIPLWLQHQQLLSLNSVSSIAGQPKSATVIRNWTNARNSDDSAKAQLLAAESVQNLSAQECRLIVDEVDTTNWALLSDLLGRWASLDGKGAFNWLSSRPSVRIHVMRDAAPAWAASDPAGYRDWLGAFLSPKDCGNDFDSYIYCKWLAPFDLRGAIRIAVQKFRESPSVSHGGLLGGQLLIDKLDLKPFISSGQDARNLADEILNHPEWLLAPRQIVSERERRRIEETPIELLRALRQCWQDVDADGWDRWASEHPEFSARAENQPQDPGDILLLSRNPESDATRILDEAPPDQKSQVMRKLIVVWTFMDLNAAGTWLRTLPESPIKWHGCGTFAWKAVQEDPTAALLWADSISDPVEQASVQRRMFTIWFDSDPMAAINWLNQSPWSPSQIQDANDIMTAGRISDR